MFKHILLPIDDSEGSRRAIELGMALARSMGAMVTGFHVMTEFAYAGIVEELLEPPPDELESLAWAHADKLFARLQSEAERADVPCEALAERNVHPWKAIVATAKSSGCDLIVMASHGRRGIARLALGSQTRQVLDHTDVSVLVVR